MAPRRGPGQARNASAPGGDSAALLLERDEARASIDSALDLAGPGGLALFFVGEAGLGKTTLLDLCWQLAGDGITLARAGCSELEASLLPFGLLTRLAESLGAPASALRSGQGAPTVAARAGLFSDLLAWIRSRASSPILLLLDDLHWADPDSLSLLFMLWRRLGGLPVALVASMRPWPPTALDQARSLEADGLARLERLSPLSRRASERLLQAHLDGAQPAQLETMAAACAGNPLLLKEAARAAQGGEDLTALGGVGPEGSRLFLPRFAGVGGPALRWARSAAVLGNAIRPSVVAALSGQSDAECDGALEALCRGGLIRPAAKGTVEFVHPLFRQALYGDISEPLRQVMHARAFRLLCERNASASEIAPHALAGELLGDAAALEVLSRAGKEALAAGAFATAAEHLSGALQVAGSTRAVAIHQDLALAFLAMGRTARAESCIRAVLEREDLAQGELVSALRLHSQILVAAARYREAASTAQQASRVALASSPDLAAEILLDTAFVNWRFDGTRQARSRVAEAMGILEHAPATSPRLHLAGQAAEWFLSFIEGDPSGLEPLARAARSWLEDISLRRQWSAPWNVVFAYGNVAKVAERFDDATHYLGAVMGLAEEHGDALTYQTLAVSLADTSWRMGRLAQARSLLERAAELGEVGPALAPFACIGMAHVTHEMGADEESEAWARRVEQLMSALGESPYLRLWLCLRNSRALLAQSRPAEAAAQARLAATTAKASGILEPCVVPWHLAAVEAHLAARDTEAAEKVLEDLEAISRPLGCMAPRAVAATGRGLLCWRKDQPDQAAGHFAAALQAAAAVPMPLVEAESLICYGRFLRSHGMLREAREALHKASECLAPTGAGRLQSLAAAELAVAGGRRSRPTARQALTAQEERVCALAAEGLTNSQIAARLYLSAKTVDHHLSAAYAKLGVASRRELMLGRANRPVPPDPAGNRSG